MTSKENNLTQNTMEATFSVLAMPIASSALMALGHAPHPQTSEITIDKAMARFNIDLLIVLKTKTRGHLSAEEERFLDSLINDLQIKFVRI